MSEEAKAKELEKARERMEKVASEKSHAEAEFYNIAQKHKMREGGKIGLVRNTSLIICRLKLGCKC